MPYVDLSRIEHLFLKENFLVGLGFPKGFVFFRVVKRELFTYNYNEIDGATANTLIADEWASAKLPDISSLSRSITNLFSISDRDDHIYQVFAGLRPSALRMYIEQPFGTAQRRLDTVARVDKDYFGFVDGFMSPYSSPSPNSELWVPYRMDIGFAWYNPTNDTILPVANWVINRYLVRPIKDPELIARILERRIECRLATVGGIADYEYAVKAAYDVNEIPIDADRHRIELALAGR